jgi:hypothetical protein
MQVEGGSNNRVRRTVNDLVMAEMFLLQATIESATVIGEGIGELGKQITDSDETGQPSWNSLSKTLQQIGDDALEPYTARFKYFRDMIKTES